MVLAGKQQGGESPLKGLRVVVIGAGGAGRALAFGAVDRGANVIVCNRRATLTLHGTRAGQCVACRVMRAAWHIVYLTDHLFLCNSSSIKSNVSAG